MLYTKAYSKLTPTSKMEAFTKIVKDRKPWTIFAKNSKICEEILNARIKTTQIRNIALNGSRIVLKIIYKWIERKGKTLLRKKKTSSWWVFFFLCSSFQTRKDLVSVKSYNATVQCFLKTFRKYALRRLWRIPFFVKF